MPRLISLESDLRTLQFAHRCVNDTALTPVSYHPRSQPMNSGLAWLAASTSDCSNARPEHPKPLRRPEVDARVYLDPLRKKVETAAWECAPPASRALRSCDCRRSGFRQVQRLLTHAAALHAPQRTAWSMCSIVASKLSDRITCRSEDKVLSACAARSQASTSSSSGHRRSDLTVECVFSGIMWLTEDTQSSTCLRQHNNYKLESPKLPRRQVQVFRLPK
jgi:hypothetical protein